MRTALALAATLVLAMAAAAGASTYYVDTNNAKAADANAGSAEAPFKTISAAAKAVKAGDTVLIKGGTYRESVRIARSGEKDKPITFKAADGERVILTGADPVTGWRKCRPEDLQDYIRNSRPMPKLENLWVADVDWTPAKPEQLRLLSGKKALAIARMPREGAWPLTRAEGQQLVFYDDVHLTGSDPKLFDGWTLLAMYEAGGGAGRHDQFTYDPAAHKITLAGDWSQYADIDPKHDTYWFENNPAGLDGPGQYAFRKTAKGLRLWVWPSQMAGDQPAVEGVRRDDLVNAQGQSFLVLDGLEICYSSGQAIGHNIKLSDSTIQNCYIHDCSGYGIGLYPGERVTLRRNIIHQCGMDIVFLGGKDNTVEENDIGWALGDGLDAAGGVRNLRIVRNYIHDNFRYGHPDNIQFWDDIDGVWIQDNLIANGGQGIMSGNLKNFHVINNLFIGTYAVTVILGGESAGAFYDRKLSPEEQLKKFQVAPPDVIEVNHNTICAANLQPTNWQGKGFTVKNNIVAPLHGPPVYSMEDPTTFVSDYNLLWPNPDNTRCLVPVSRIATVKQGDKDVLKMATDRDATTLAVLQEKTGQEKHSVLGDPQFVNAPKFCIASDYRRIANCTRTKLLLWGKAAGNFAVGETVEVAFDGVARKLTEVGDDYIVFDPPLADLPAFMQTVVNWGRKTDIAWNLALADESPGRKKAEDGRDMGSNINIKQYMNGDFNGDGKRELPEMPKE